MNANLLEGERYRFAKVVKFTAKNKRFLNNRVSKNILANNAFFSVLKFKETTNLYHCNG